MKPCFRKIRRHFFGQLYTLLQNTYFHHVVNPHMFLLFSFPGAFTTYSKNTYSPFKLLFWNMFLSFFLTMVTETYNVYTYTYIIIYIYHIFTMVWTSFSFNQYANHAKHILRTYMEVSWNRGTPNHPSHGWPWLSIETLGDLWIPYFKKPTIYYTPSVKLT